MIQVIIEYHSRFFKLGVDAPLKFSSETNPKNIFGVNHKTILTVKDVIFHAKTRKGERSKEHESKTKRVNRKQRPQPDVTN